MGKERAARLKMTVIRMFNRIAVGLHIIRVSWLLASRELASRLGAPLRGARRRTSPRHALGTTALVALMVAPTILYLVERHRHQERINAYRTLSLIAASEQSFLRSSVKDLVAERNRLTEMLLDTGHVVDTGAEIKVKVVATGYSSSVWETDSTPFITAANTRTRLGIMAMSRDLLREYTPGAPFAFGDRVHVDGLGEFIVEDTMNRRFTNRIDIWFPNRLEALRFGIRTVHITAPTAGREPVSFVEPTLDLPMASTVGDQ